MINNQTRDWIVLTTKLPVVASINDERKYVDVKRKVKNASW